MRGLPGSGKSYRARQLACESGIILETDAIYRNPERYGLCDASMEVARAKNLDLFCRAINSGQSTIVVDRGNGLNDETYIYVNLARSAGYRVRLVEPDSPWWREIRTLLRYRPHTDAILECWAHELARINQRTNQVPASTILDWLDGWVADLSTEELLEHADGFNVDSAAAVHQEV